MLAPLEDRCVLTVRGCDEECAVERELHELRRALRASRLRLCDGVARTLATGLDLLGIEVMERM